LSAEQSSHMITIHDDDLIVQGSRPHQYDDDNDDPLGSVVDCDAQQRYPYTYIYILIVYLYILHIYKYLHINIYV
jgi:hypothetical protein